MSSIEEWNQYRLNQLKPLEGLSFRLQRYQAPTDEWDHDHCCGCWAKFAGFDGEGILHEGFMTSMPSDDGPPDPDFIDDCKAKGMTCIREPIISGFALRWVCCGCFEEFREVLGFRLQR
jgi:hypothetical protein